MLEQKYVHIVESLDKEVIRETKSNRAQNSNVLETNNSVPNTNRQYDSDIFVQSNTTFEQEDLTNKSSKRNSATKRRRYQKEMLFFVDTS